METLAGYMFIFVLATLIAFAIYDIVGVLRSRRRRKQRERELQIFPGKG